MHRLLSRPVASLLSAFALAAVVQVQVAPVWAATAVATTGTVTAASAREGVVSADVLAQLAPTGVLRVGVYPGSPTSLMPGAAGAEPAGIAHDLGRALGRRAGVTVRLVEFARVAEIVEAVQRGEVDFTFTNASVARARLVDFTQPLVRLELGVLVPVGSPVSSLESLDRAGVRVGVTQGSSSLAALGARLIQARIVQARSIAMARQMLAAGELDAFATNKGILFELADQVPGARVLDGRWGYEQLAIALPKGRPLALQFVESWAMRELPAAELQTIIQRSGLRGIARD